MANRIQDVIQRGTRVNQPAANSVATGTIYYVTDESVTERSTGSAWEDISDAGSGGDHGGLTGLTDDDHTQYVLVSGLEVDRTTINSNWEDLTDGGETSLHSHAGGSYDGTLASNLNEFIEAPSTTQPWEKILAGSNITVTEVGNGEAISIAASGGGGGLVLVEAKVITVASQVETFSGLDGDTDRVYFLVWVINNTSGGTATYNIEPNGISTNQWSRRFVIASGGTVNDTFASLYITSLVTNDRSSGVSWIFAAKSQGSTALQRSTITLFGGDGSSDDATGQSSVMVTGTWNETSTNITSLEIQSDVAASIGAGSLLLLYKLAQS